MSGNQHYIGRGEARDVEVDFTDLISVGRTVQSATVNVQDTDGAAVASGIAISAISVNSPLVAFRVTVDEGMAPGTYHLVIEATLDNAEEEQCRDAQGYPYRLTVRP